LFLLAGVLEYLGNRPTGSTYLHLLLQPLAGWFHHIPPLYGKLGTVAPDFFHSLALSLLLVAFFVKRQSRMIICLTWFGIESLFELGQRYGMEIVEYLPGGLETVPMMGNLEAYLVNGTFDFYDLIAFGLGSLTAFTLGELTTRKGGRDGRE
jgi:hypothetical protein